jgi:hypothetical protein
MFLRTYLRTYVQTYPPYVCLLCAGPLESLLPPFVLLFVSARWRRTMSCVLCQDWRCRLPELSLLPRSHFSISAQAKYGVLCPVSGLSCWSVSKEFQSSPDLEESVEAESFPFLKGKGLQNQPNNIFRKKALLLLAGCLCPPVRDACYCLPTPL